MNDTIIVTGITGQDGSHMVDYLLENTDYNIVGTSRRLSVPNDDNIKHVNSERFEKVYFDLTDNESIQNVIQNNKPKYFINLAAQSFVGASWDIPVSTWNANATGVLHILESIRKFSPKTKFYNAGTSEEFGDVLYSPQDENHPLRPRSPYGASKTAARHLVKVYRDSYDIYAVQGWLFNHEGVRRGEEFVTRKISRGVARIHHAIKNDLPFDPIELGNLDAKRDWSDSEDFVDGIWKMLNQHEPKDYVLSSNETHSIREFIEKAFLSCGIEGVWHGEREKEQFSISTENYHKINGHSSVLIKINEKFYRPAEVDLLLGDSTPARKELGWEPQISFDKLVSKMVKFDIDNYKI